MKRKVGIFILSLVMIFGPTFASEARYNIIPNCNKGAINTTTGSYAQPCDFNALIQLINNVIHFLLFVIATPLVALIICYAGFLFLTSGGSAETRNKAKKILKNVIIGYIIGLAAWLIVNTIVKTLGFTGNTFLQQY